MIEEMRAYFDRLRETWESAGEQLPRVPWDPEAGPQLWEGPPDDDEYVAWRPVEKADVHDLDVIAPDLAPLHPSIHRYFNSWWFAALEGEAGEYGVTLLPVLPGLELDDFLAQARAYAEAHGGRLERVPIGVEYEGLQVVVDNSTGEVAVEDWERGDLDPIAPSLDELIAELRP